MDRRRLLRAVGGASLAVAGGGCVGRIGSVLADPTVLAEVSHESTTTADGIALDVTVTEKRATAEHPPRVRLAFTNETDGTIRSPILDDPDQASGIWSDAPSGGRDRDGDGLPEYPETKYVMAPAARSYEEEDEACWRDPSIPVRAVVRETELDPDESARQTYELWNKWTDVCYPSGVYDFPNDSDEASWECRLEIRTSQG